MTSAAEAKWEAETAARAQAQADRDDAVGHLPCVGWGPHTHATVEAGPVARVCWACWVKGYELTARPKPGRHEIVVEGYV